MFKSVSSETSRVIQNVASSVSFSDAEPDPTAHERNADLKQLTADVLAAATSTGPEIARHRAVTEAVAGLLSASNKNTRYRAWFVVGALDLVVTSIWLGASPSTFYYFWLFKLTGIMAQRVWVFARRRMLFFLLSLCYVCSAAGAVHVCCFLDSIPAAKMMFSVGVAPMAGTALLMKNRLVLHEWNSLSLLFIHWGLGVLAWTLRWYPPAPLAAAIAASPAAAADWAHISFTHCFVWPSLLYAAWGASFLLLVNVLLAGVVRRGKYDTQYSKALEGGMGIISAITNSFPRPLRPLSFLLAQYTLYAPPLAYVPLLWNNYYAGIFLLGAIYSAAAWHGSRAHLGGAKPARAAKQQ